MLSEDYDEKCDVFSFGIVIFGILYLIHHNLFDPLMGLVHICRGHL